MMANRIGFPTPKRATEMGLNWLRAMLASARRLWLICIGILLKKVVFCWANCYRICRSGLPAGSEPVSAVERWVPDMSWLIEKLAWLVRLLDKHSFRLGNTGDSNR